MELLGMVFVTTKIPQLTSNLDTLGLDVFDDFQSSLGDEGHVLAMAVFSEETRCADNNIQAIDTSVDRHLDIAHITTDI